jgi:hypothetical protein
VGRGLSQHGGPSPVRQPAPFAPFAGMIGLACVLFLDVAAVLVLPWWAVVLLVLVWVPLLVVACRWWTPHPGRVPWVAVFGALLWVAVAIGGNALL